MSKGGREVDPLGGQTPPDVKLKLKHGAVLEERGGGLVLSKDQFALPDDGIETSYDIELPEDTGSSGASSDRDGGHTPKAG